MNADYLALIESNYDGGKVRHLLRYSRQDERVTWLSVFSTLSGGWLGLMRSSVHCIAPDRFLDVMGNDNKSGKLKYIGQGRCNREAK